MKFGKLYSIMAIIASTVVISSIGGYAAGVTDKTVHSRDSLLIGCADLGPTFDAIKLKPGESKTIGCVHGGDMTLPRFAHKVIYCNHDNWWTWSKDEYMDINSVWKISCVEP